MKKTVLLLVISLCAAAGSSATEPGAPFRAAAGPDGVQRVAVVAGNYFFRPDRIVVRVNQPVELKVQKEPGMVPHDLILKAPEAGIDIEVRLEKEPKIVTFLPKKTGSFPFFCDKKLLFLESHRAKGMEGVLEVVP